MTLENMGMEEFLANKQCLFWFLEVERVEVESGKSLSLNIRKSGHAIFSLKTADRLSALIIVPLFFQLGMVWFRRKGRFLIEIDFQTAGKVIVKIFEIMWAPHGIPYPNRKFYFDSCPELKWSSGQATQISRNIKS